MKKRIAVPWSMQMQKDLQDLYPHQHLRYQKDECNSLIGGCGHLSEAWRDVSDSNRTVLHTIPYKYTLLHNILVSLLVVYILVGTNIF